MNNDREPSCLYKALGWSRGCRKILFYLKLLVMNTTPSLFCTPISFSSSCRKIRPINTDIKIDCNARIFVAAGSLKSACNCRQRSQRIWLGSDDLYLCKLVLIGAGLLAGSSDLISERISAISDPLSNLSVKERTLSRHFSRSLTSMAKV